MRTLIGLLIFASLFISATALPCSPPFCLEARFVPQSGSIPANTPGFVLSPRAGYSSDVETASVTLSSADGESIPVRIERHPDAFHALLVHVERPLSAGTNYILDHYSLCMNEMGLPAPQIFFSTTAAAALPAVLGRLRATDRGVGPLTVGAGAACSADINAARVEIELTLDPQMLPWQHALYFETYVDGQRWAPVQSIGTGIRDNLGVSWRGPARDELYSNCDRSGLQATGLTPGAHQVEMRASIPGGPTLSTPRIEVVLSCPEPQPDAGVDPIDSGADPIDGGVAPDATASDARAKALPEVEESSSCACVTASRSPSVLWLAAALGLVWIRRRSIQRDARARRSPR